MRLNNISTVTFGYDRELNKQLVERLRQNPNLPANRTLLRINQTCNQTENLIRRLEGKKYQDIDNNENIINFLLDYLFDAKVYLARKVSRLFPDLNFMKRECDNYKLEYDEQLITLDDGEEKSEEGLERFAYQWRKNLSMVMTTEEEIENEYQEDAGAKGKYDNMPSKVSAQNKDVSELVKKYTPYSHSPKSLGDVVGLDKSVEDIRDLIVYPLQDPKGAKEREEDYGIKIPDFIIFYGPPGCGKTMLSQAIQAETNCDMYLMDVSRLGSMYVNASANNITAAFDKITKDSKTSSKPVLVFIDEMDSLMAKRTGETSGSKEDNKVVNTLLQHIVAARDNNLIIIGATNMYDLVDSAVKDRAKLKYYIGLPDDEQRAELLRRNLSEFKKGQPLANNPEVLAEISRSLRPYSPRTIKNIVEKASLNAFKHKREVGSEDFKEVLAKETFEKIREEEYKPKKQKEAVGFSIEG